MENIVILFIILILLLYFYNNKKESFDPQAKNITFIETLYNGIINGTIDNFEKYINFLKENKNKDLKLIDYELFLEFIIAKKNGTLTIQYILNKI
jgi:hypothetical protein